MRGTEVREKSEQFETKPLSPRVGCLEVDDGGAGGGEGVPGCWNSELLFTSRINPRFATTGAALEGQ